MLALLKKTGLLVSVRASTGGALLFLVLFPKSDLVAFAAATPVVSAGSGFLVVVSRRFDILGQSRVGSAIVGDDVAGT